MAVPGYQELVELVASQALVIAARAELAAQAGLGLAVSRSPERSGPRPPGTPGRTFVESLT